MNARDHITQTVYVCHIGSAVKHTVIHLQGLHSGNSVSEQNTAPVVHVLNTTLLTLKCEKCAAQHGSICVSIVICQQKAGRQCTVALAKVQKILCHFAGLATRNTMT
jgi:hypothetical protein